MGLRKLPQANVHPNFKAPIRGSDGGRLVNTPPQPAQYRTQVRDKVALKVLTIPWQRPCRSQPGLHRFQIDSGLPEIVGISPRSLRI